MLTAGIVLAVMVLPIITALTREIFLQTPKLHEEAALAMGATRWEMIKMSVLPFARPGIISAAMLGLGRALGETMAVALVLSGGGLAPSLIQNGNQTIAAEIALNFPEAYGLRLSELIAAGLSGLDSNLRRSREPDRPYHADRRYRPGRYGAANYHRPDPGDFPSNTETA